MMAIASVASALLAALAGWAIVKPTLDASQATQDSAAADQSAEEREQQQDKERMDNAAGPPVEIVPGDPNPDLIPKYQALPEPTHENEWTAKEDGLYHFMNNWLPSQGSLDVSIVGSRFTIGAAHDTTVIVQNMRLSDVLCGPATNGTLVDLPPTQGGGEIIDDIFLAFDLTEANPKAREVMPHHYSQFHRELGEDFFDKSLYLEGGEVADRRTFEVEFITGNRDCEFGLEVLVTGSKEEAWVPVELRDGVYRLAVAGVADSYESVIGWATQDFSMPPEIMPAEILPEPFTVTRPGRESEETAE